MVSKRSVLALIVLPFLLLAVVRQVNQRRLDMALQQAAEEPSAGIINVLITKGANIKYRDSHGLTALHYAALRGVDNSRTIKILIAHGAEVNAADNDGVTPLHYALMSENPSSIKAFVELGANPNFYCKRFGTPFYQSLSEFHGAKNRRNYSPEIWSEIARILAKHGGKATPKMKTTFRDELKEIKLSQNQRRSRNGALRFKSR